MAFDAGADEHLPFVPGIGGVQQLAASVLVADDDLDADLAAAGCAEVPDDGREAQIGPDDASHPCEHGDRVTPGFGGKRVLGRACRPSAVLAMEVGGGRLRYRTVASKD